MANIADKFYDDVHAGLLAVINVPFEARGIALALKSAFERGPVKNIETGTLLEGTVPEPAYLVGPGYGPYNGAVMIAMQLLTACNFSDWGGRGDTYYKHFLTEKGIQLFRDLNAQGYYSKHN